MVGWKDACKMAGIVVLTFCAVFVCTLFLNFQLDIVGLEDKIASEEILIFYHAQIATGKVVCAVSGGCLLLTTAIMLFFYIRQYIDSHGRELGILKALGYSRIHIAGNFWVFGLGVFAGTIAGYLAAHCLMPKFYEVQNEKKLLPDYSIQFHPILAVCLVVLPTVFFALLAIGSAWMSLKRPAVELLKGAKTGRGRKERQSKRDLQGGKVPARRGRSLQEGERGKERSFLQDIRSATVRQRASLVFFIGFAAFCYASMMQMSLSMEVLGSSMMAVMILGIGILLAGVTLFLAITTVVNSNKKSIAMMRVFGYSFKDISRAVLGGYRPFAWLGFLIGTGYQYGLLKIMVTWVYREVLDVPSYQFDVPNFWTALLSFAVLYELVMYGYTRRIRQISVKEIMMEE